MKLFGRGKKYEDCATVRLEEDAGLAAGRYLAADLSPTKATFVAEESNDWPAEKTFSFAVTPQGFEITCDVALRRTAPGNGFDVRRDRSRSSLSPAPSAPDRYFETHGQHYPLRWPAATPASELRIVGRWEGIGVTLAAPNAQGFGSRQLKSVSESGEDGSELTHQGSEIMAVWPVELAPGTEWKGRLALKAGAARGSKEGQRTRVPQYG